MLTSSNHESQYQQRTQKFDRLVSDEEYRRALLRKLLLEVDRDVLSEELVYNDNRNDMLERDCEMLRECLKRSEQDCQYRLAETQRHARELEALREELRLTQSSAVDARKLLDTKSNLEQELRVVQTELEQLRQRVAERPALAAENASLRQQVTLLESARTDEQSLTKRDMSSQHSAQTAMLNNRIRELQQGLNDERRRNEQLQNATHKESMENNPRILALEERLERFRAKLRKTKDELKSTQAELEQSRDAARTGAYEADAARASMGEPKQKACQRAMNVNLGTPDGPTERGKRRGHHARAIDQVCLGEKSTFSITPFLKRTVGSEGGQPVNQDCVTERHALDDAGTPLQRNPVSHAAVLQENSQSVNQLLSFKDVSNLSRPELSKTLMHTDYDTSAPTGQQNLVSQLNVIREENDENVVGYQSTALQFEPLAQHSGTTEVVRKRRKVLGYTKTLFDDDDAEKPKRHSKVIPGAAKKATKRLATLAKADTEGLVNRFGSFSPLKKERRGAGKSFLA